MYDIATGEKKFLQIINATVSHEMRNPINSIKSQVLLQKILNQKINELINDKKILKIKTLKKRLRKILFQYCESVKIQSSSENMLNFLVSDILDFA